MARLFQLLTLCGALVAAVSAGEPSATESSKRASDREKYSRFLRASLEGQLDVVHDELSKVLSFEKHTVKVDPASKPRVLRVKRDMSPLAADTPEDRLLRELKATHKLVSPDSAPKDEIYGLGERRPDGEPYKVAPRSLDPAYEQRVAAAMGLGMKPATAPTSLYHGRLSNKPHYSSADPGTLMFGAGDAEAAKVAKAAEPDSKAAAAVAAAAKAKGRKDPTAKGPLPADPAAAEVALGLSSVEKPQQQHQQAGTALAASLSADQDAAASVFGVVPLYEFRSDEMRDHFLTTQSALAATDGVDQWKDRREVCRVYKDAAPATVPLYLLWDKSTLDHRYSTTAQPPAGYRNDGVVAHVYAKHVPGSVALHEFYDANAHDHMYAVDARELRARQARGEVTYAGVACYVLPSSAQAQAAMSTSSLLSEISRLTDETDVLASKETVEDSEFDGPAWTKPTGGADKSMMAQLAMDPSSTTDKVATLVSEPKGKKRSSKDSNESNESSEPESVPEVTEDAREEASAADAPTVTGPPPNDLVVDETAEGARVPRVVAMYEYYNPQIRDHYYTIKYDVLADGMADWQLNGPRFWVFDSPEFNTVPLYKYWSLENGDHYYTLEKFTTHEYKYTGVAGYVFAKSGEDTVALHRYYSRDTADHIYTIHREDEKQKALGFAYEGIQCYVFDSAKDNLLPQDFRSKPGVLANMYRYYNSETNHHFYTTSTTELQGNMLAHGWNSEGVAGRIHIYPQSGLVPLRRYWNVRSLTHYYSTRWLKLKGGWSYDGIQGYVSDKLIKGTVPLYRFYNPSADDDIYTTDRAEVRGRSDRDAWVFKGVTCYVYSVEDESPSNVYRYYNPKSADFFYTTDKSIFGTGKDGWILQKAAFSAYREGVRGTVPVHSYYHPSNFDHLYTTKYFPNRKDGWVYRGVAYYAYPDDAENGSASKLYRFYNPESKTHYYTTDPGEAGETRPGVYAIAKQDGWFFYGTTAQVMDPTPETDSDFDTPVPIYGFYSRPKQLMAFSVNAKFKANGFSSTGVAFQAWPKKTNGAAPVFRYYNKKTKIFSFSNERLSGDTAKGSGDYNGVAFWVSRRSREGSIPLYIFRSKSGVQSLTTDPAHNKGWSFAGVAGYVIPAEGAAVASPQAVYQYYSPSRTEHFYTINWGLLGHGRDGWQLEGSPFMALAYKGNGRAEVYDHYDGNGKLHTLSTKSQLPSDTKTPTIAFRVVQKKGKGLLPIFEYYNAAASDHVYAVDEKLFSKAKDGSLSYRGSSGWVKSKTPLGYAYPPEKAMTMAKVPTGSKAVYISERRDKASEFTFSRTTTTQQPAFYAYTESKPGSVPLYTFENAKNDDVLYTTKWFKPTDTWTGGDVAMYVLPKRASGTVPMYRFFDRKNQRHHFTTSLDGLTMKMTDVVGPKGKKYKAKRWSLRGHKELLRYEGVQAYVFSPPVPRLPVFALYNPKTSKHMYSTDATTVPVGWRNLGVKFFAYGSQFPGTSAMNEYVNQKTGQRTLARGKAKVPKGTVMSPKPSFYVFGGPGDGRKPLHWYSNAGVKDNVYLVNQRVMMPSKIKGAWKFLDDDTDGWKYEGVAGFVYQPTRHSGIIR